MKIDECIEFRPAATGTHRSFSGPPLWPGDGSPWSGSGIPAPLRQAWGSRPLVCPGCHRRFAEEDAYVTHWYTQNQRENAPKNTGVHAQ